MVQSCFGLCQLPYGFAILPLRPPPPDLSVHLHQGLENLGVHDGSSLRISFFPRMRATPITGPQNSLTGVQQGKRLGSGTPETCAQARNGSARVRVTTGSQIALAGDSVILSAAEHFLRFVVNRQSKSREPYFFTAMACNSKCPPRRSDPAPMNSRAGISLVVK